jgi:hypothetical protein
MFKVLGIALIILAIAAAVVPMFTDCESQGLQIKLANGTSIPMKCHWSGLAEFGTAIPLAAIGVLLVIARRKETLSYLSILGVVTGAVLVAIPNWMIGVCATPTHTCVTIMRPLLTVFGSLAAAGSIIGLVMAQRIKEE